MTTFLYILGYFVGAILTTWIAYRFFYADKEDAIACGMAWPIVWFFCPVILMFAGVVYGIEWITKIWDRIEDRIEERNRDRGKTH